MNEQLYLGVEIGGTKLQVVLGNDNANIIDRRRFTVDRSAGDKGIRDQIAHGVADFRRNHRISAAGVGFGGPIDWRSGRVALSHHVEGWTNFELASWMADLIQAPVQVDNDANTAALAEATRGAGQTSNPVFYATLGSGVGGGFVIDRKIVHGAIPGEAEIGHLRLDKSGTTVEQRCSGWAVDKRIQEALREQPQSLLTNLVGKQKGGEAKFLRAAAEGGDSLATMILEEVAEDLAFALAHVTHLLHPQVIVLGGGLSLTGNLLREAVARHHRRFLMQAFQPGPDIRIAQLGEDVVPVGALLLAKSAG